jgi:hypothetical protein
VAVPLYGNKPSLLQASQGMPFLFSGYAPLRHFYVGKLNSFAAGKAALIFQEQPDERCWLSHGPRGSYQRFNGRHDEVIMPRH